MPRRGAGAVVARRGPAVLIARPAVPAAARARLRSVSRASAAGITFTNRTLKAEWAARYGHTSVIDAAGAIYVIGGFNGTYRNYSIGYYQDAWVSTDGGARPDSVGGWSGVHQGILRGYSRGTLGCSRGYFKGFADAPSLETHKQSNKQTNNRTETHTCD
jgi:hypothetical protein